ncbi:MAG: hypothetical protein Q9160_006213 [Pyrenula sp. 1 TL-2023]
MAATSNNTRFEILSLPLELRLQIYSAIWPPSTVLRLRPQLTPRKKRASTPPSPHHSQSPFSLLHVSSALRADALPIFHLHTSIYLNQQPYMRDLLQSPSIINRVQHLTLYKPPPTIGYDSWSDTARSWRLPKLLSAAAALRSLTIVQRPGYLANLGSREQRYRENQRQKVRSDAGFWLRDVMSVPFELVVRRVDRDESTVFFKGHQPTGPRVVKEEHRWRFEVEAMGEWDEEVGEEGKVRSRWRRMEGWEEFDVERVRVNEVGILVRSGQGVGETEEQEPDYSERWKRQKSEVVVWRKKPPKGMDPRPRWEYAPPHSSPFWNCINNGNTFTIVADPSLG